MTTDYYAVIMAGGGGTRLWPLSRRDRPKQTLRFFGQRSLFQVAVDRVRPVVTEGRILVVTVEEQADLLRQQVPSLPEDNFVLEPAPRGTASVVGLAAVMIQHENPQAVMAVLTADHFIAHVSRFQKLLRAAYELALEGDLVTLGITPDYPDTGYGYIHQGKPRGSFQGYQAYRVRSFTEKPAHEQARDYLESGEFVWNSGMFVWRAGRILEEIERQMPALHDGLRSIREALGTGREREVIEEVWSGLQSETIDYGVMEGAENVSVIPADDLGWLDVGGWNRLFDLLETDELGNLIVAANTLLMDTKDTLVYQDAERGGERLIAALGVENLIVVDSGDVVLICPRDQAQRVRQLVQVLSDQDEDRFL